MKKMILNPNKDYRIDMQMAIERNGGFCPCIVKKTQESICPCVDFREHQKCHCDLYVEVKE